MSHSENPASSTSTYNRFFTQDGDGRQLMTASWKNFPTIPFENAEHRLDEFYNHFQLRPDDVLLVGFPKSGHHWMRHVISRLLLPQSHVQEAAVMENSFIEFVSLSQLNALASPRVLSTHLHVHQLPQSLLACKRIIFLLRNPKDVAVSYFHHLKGIKRYAYEAGRWEGYFDIWNKSTKDSTGMLNWFQYNQHWIHHLRQGGLAKKPHLMMRYEDMHIDTVGQIRRVAEFLNVSCGEELVQKIVQETSIDNLRQLDRGKHQQVHNVAENFTFYRKGIIGDWINYFTPAQSESFDHVYFEVEKMQELNLEVEKYMQHTYSE